MADVVLLAVEPARYINSGSAVCINVRHMAVVGSARCRRRSLLHLRDIYV
jgi:hypothetical protein